MTRVPTEAEIEAAALAIAREYGFSVSVIEYRIIARSALTAAYALRSSEGEVDGDGLVGRLRSAAGDVGRAGNILAATDLITAADRLNAASAPTRAPELPAIKRENASDILDLCRQQPEPSDDILDHATYILSEWLNDSAPIGERRYREPAKALLKFASLFGTESAAPPPSDRNDALARKGIYFASKVKHARRWRLLRDQVGYPIISTWIDEAGEGQSKDMADLWRRCIAEASTAEVLVINCDPGEVLKGGWIELGAALASNVPVLAVGIEAFTIASDKRIEHFGSMAEITNYLKPMTGGASFASIRALKSKANDGVQG